MAKWSVVGNRVFILYENAKEVPTQHVVIEYGTWIIASNLAVQHIGRKIISKDNVILSAKDKVTGVVRYITEVRFTALQVVIFDNFSHRYVLKPDQYILIEDDKMNHAKTGERFDDE